MNSADHLYLFTVNDRMSLKDVGLILLPGVPHGLREPAAMRDVPVTLLTPAGEIIDTRTSGTELCIFRTRVTLPAEETPVVLPDLEQSDVPIGTEVYLRLSCESDALDGDKVIGENDPP